MQISKSSWHYRFIDKLGISLYWRRDLCSYMRGFMFACFKLFGIAVLCGIAVFMACTILFCMGYALLAGLLGLNTYVDAFVIGSILWSVVSLLGMLYVVGEVRGRQRHKSPGPFKQWLSDRNSKVCRLVTYTD